MARAAAKPKKEVSMEEALWKSADKLRGSVEPAEYKHVVLSLFFLKFASDKFEAQRKKLTAAGYEAQIEKTFAYTKDNVFYLPPESRWSYIMENAKQDDIALKIDTALYTIEKTNPALKGALPDNYYSRLAIDTNKLASRMRSIRSTPMTRKTISLGESTNTSSGNSLLQKVKARENSIRPNVSSISLLR